MKKTVRILLIGLDGAGKTVLIRQTLLEQLKKRSGQKSMALRKIPPTVGLNSTFYVVGKVLQNNLEILLWDLGGKQGIRNIWTHYYDEAEFLIFLIDGADRSRFLEAKQVFRELVNEEKLRSIPFIFLVNKHDLENCASIGYIKEYFELEKETHHQTVVFHISALTQ